jgi:hypothetical protein
MIKRILLQVGFWITIFVINLALVPGDYLASNALLFEMICVAAYAFLFYLNVLFLFPKYYEKSRIKYFILGIVLILMVFMVMHAINRMIFWRPEGRRHHNDWFEMFFTIRYLLWFGFIYLIGTVYSIQHMLNQQIIRNKKMMEEKLETELKLLKAQINPLPV